MKQHMRIFDETRRKGPSCDLGSRNQRFLSLPQAIDAGDVGRTCQQSLSEASMLSRLVEIDIAGPAG